MGRVRLGRGCYTFSLPVRLMLGHVNIELRMESLMYYCVARASLIAFNAATPSPPSYSLSFLPVIASGTRLEERRGCVALTSYGVQLPARASGGLAGRTCSEGGEETTALMDLSYFWHRQHFSRVLAGTSCNAHTTTRGGREKTFTQVRAYFCMSGRKCWTQFALVWT